MSTQTVYFTNPTVISNLESSVSTNSTNITVLQSTTTSMSGSIASLNDNNKWARGTPISMELISTIPVNSSTGPIWSWNGPSQAVKVYKLTFYSSAGTDYSVERYSATVYVPTTISTGTVCCFMQGITPTDNEYTSGWQSFGTGDYGTWWQSLAYGAFAPIARGSPLGLAPSALGGAVVALGSYSQALLNTSAAAQMVLINPDPIGFGESQNMAPWNYFNFIYPTVDALRSLRLAILRQPTIFNSFSFPTVLPIFLSGYSRGGIFAPAVMNEFQILNPALPPFTVSPTMPLAEANKFTFTKAFFGGVPELITRLQSQIAYDWYIPKELFTVMLLGFNPQQVPGQSNLWNQHAINTLAPLIYDADYSQAAQIVSKIDAAIRVDSSIYPPTSTGYGLWSQYTGSVGGFSNGFIDVRQFFKQEYLQPNIFSEYFRLNNGWANQFRTLQLLNNIPIAVAGCYQDTVVSTINPNDGSLVNDSSVGLDVYMATGALYGEGTSYQITATGALKTINISNLTFATGVAADVVTYSNQIASEVRTMSSTAFNRYSIDNQYVLSGYYTTPQKFGTHGNWADFQYFNILRSILTGETIPY
jgi:hypothetical protein